MGKTTAKPKHRRCLQWCPQISFWAALGLLGNVRVMTGGSGHDRRADGQKAANHCGGTTGSRSTRTPGQPGDDGAKQQIWFNSAPTRLCWQKYIGKNVFADSFEQCKAITSLREADKKETLLSISSIQSSINSIVSQPKTTTNNSVKTKVKKKRKKVSFC